MFAHFNIIKHDCSLKPSCLIDLLFIDKPEYTYVVKFYFKTVYHILGVCKLYTIWDPSQHLYSTFFNTSCFNFIYESVKTVLMKFINIFKRSMTCTLRLFGYAAHVLTCMLLLHLSYNFYHICIFVVNSTFHLFCVL